jgi:hypothetical protein
MVGEIKSGGILLVSFFDNKERQPAVRTINGIGMYRASTGRAFPLTDQFL